MGAPYNLVGKQKQFVTSGSRRLAFFGGIRAGKTIGGCLRVLLLAHEYPGIPIIVCRQTYPQLTSTTLREMESIVKELNGGSLGEGPLLVKYNRSINGVDALTMIVRSKDPNRPSRIQFMYADNIPLVLGQEHGAAYIDQVEGVDQDIFNHIDTRLSYWNASRTADFKERYGYDPKHFLFVTGNPDPGWVYEKFKLKPDEDWEFIEIETSENIANLPPGYIEEVTKGKPDIWVKRWLQGSWDIRGGQIYNEFDDDIHTCQSFDLPIHWPRFVAMDWGFGHPTAIYWGAVSEEGVIYVYREYFNSGVLASDVANTAIELSKNDPVTRWNGGLEIYMPCDMWQHRGQVDYTVADEFMNRGIQGIQANRSVEAGILRVQERLHPVNGKVGIKIFKDKCPNLIKGMKLYMSDEETGRPIKKDDDAVDAVRYLVMAISDNKAMIPKKTEPEIDIDKYAWQIMNRETTNSQEFL